MSEPDHDEIMNHYVRAEMLINKGYPVPNDDPYELAKILALKEKESINRNEGHDAATSTLSRHSNS